VSRYTAGAALLCVLLTGSPAYAEPIDTSASVCFTPAEDCEALIVAHIAAAQQSIRLQAYYLTSTTILSALRDAIKRGVKVEAILDRVNARKKTASANYLRLAGAAVWIDQSVAIAHNKLMIIDGDEVIGGSFNYTRSAQDRNAENVTILDGRSIAAAFDANWIQRRSRSVPYTP
jgi:phosphatidylserine/phosphatidylglycerophosphate/cardiolipin synthase-like enzyme